MKIIGVSGSLRKDSYNTLLLRTGAGMLTEPASMTIYDLATIPFYNEDIDTDSKPKPVEAWLDAIASADALIFATPEYNHSVPAVLKNAIDWASRPAFRSVLANKPAGIISASMSLVGGARAQIHLKDILASTLTPVYTAPDYLLPMAQDTFDSAGQLHDETATRRLRRYLNGFVQWAGTVIQGAASSN